ncbi:hypothetical protein Poli38472_004965 [Pythium oligandrum]|uniref:Uncharacterized protein n=1 Tax=Pythium oligandrum TaxID=41045 RepID=A0A8K1FEW8_PYTOL|nr:hypothetical protein Poli38472_004965 [Pythium oligandrum]|eukprot:TMW59896.1 hypothetical protein Poli38472_004965 [Pythium oligandrum]
MDVDDENDVVWRMLRDAFGETDGPMDTASSSSSTTDTRHSLKRRKDEIRTLKNEIETLERQRDELSRLERPTPSRAASVNEVWRDLATRQARKRRQAEQLNSRLRTSLETQSKIQKELVRLVQRATTPEDQTWLVRSVYGGVPRCFQSKSEESELLCRLERLYEQRDDALALSDILRVGLRFAMRS